MPASAPVRQPASSGYGTATGPVEGFVASDSATGTKTGTPLMETPQSISVIPREQIEQQGAVSISDALHYTPGVIVDVRPSSRYDIVNIRGLGNLQSFVHFQDGLKQQRGLNFDVPVTDPYLLERIEIFRGAASVLYGQVGVGGLVNLVSKKPTNDPFGEIAVQFGSHGHKQFAFDFGGPVDREGQLSYRLTGLARESGTDIYGVNEERFAIAPSITWRPTTATTLTILASYLNDPKSSYSVAVPAVGSALPNGAFPKIPHYFNPGEPAYDTFKREQASIGYLFEHRFDDVWTVRQNFRYMSLDTTFAALQTSALGPTMANPLLGPTEVSRNKSLTINSVDTFAVDSQAEAKFVSGGVKHTLLFGLDYQHTSAKGALSGGGPAAAAPTIDYLNPVYGLAIARPTIATNNKGESSQIGLYAQDQIQIGNLHGVIGGRFDWADYDFRTSATTPTSYDVSTRDEEFTWRAGLLYQFSNGIAPYFSYATSFEPLQGTAIAEGGGPLKPLTGEQYEVGIKYQPTGLNAIFTLALFDMTLQNVTSSCGTNCFRQLGEVRSRGVELEARAAVNRSLDLVAAYTYLDTEVTKSELAVELGKRPTAVPAHMASLWAFYTFREGALNGFGFGGGVRYIGETYGNIPNTWKVDSIFLVDAAVSYDFGALSPAYKGFKAQVNATNLLDDEHLASCGAFGGGFPATGATNSACHYGAGRNVIATFKYQW